MRILLLTDIPPCTNYPAGIVMNKWCEFLLEEGHVIDCVLISSRNLIFDIPEDKQKRMYFLTIDKPNEFWKRFRVNNRFNRFVAKIKSFFSNLNTVFFILPNIVNKVTEYAKQKQSELIFTSIQGQTMTRIVRPIANKTKLPYVAQTWDPLEWWLRDHCFDSIFSSLAIREFKNVVKRAKNFMAMSWAMSIAFEKEYGGKCVTNIPSLDDSQIEVIRNDNLDCYVISFAGKLYAKDEFKVLIMALERMEWKCNGRDILIKRYGTPFEDEYCNNPHILYGGYLSQDLLLQQLCNADLLYCPYWFNKDYEKVCKLSFPSKLVSYLKTGVPVLIHAPIYASPRILLERYNAAYICKSLIVDDMISLITNIFKDKERFEVGQRGLYLFNNYMTYKVMKKSLLISLGLLDKDQNQELEEIKELYY